MSKTVEMEFAMTEQSSNKPLYFVQIDALDEQGMRTGRQCNTVLSLTQLEDAETIRWMVEFSENGAKNGQSEE